MCMRAMVGRGSVIRVTVRMYFLTKVSFWMDPGVPTFTDYLLYLFTLIVIVFHLPFFFFFSLAFLDWNNLSSFTKQAQRILPWAKRY